MHNKSGSITTTLKEWGSKARKYEEAERGLNNRGRKEAIKEGLIEYEQDVQPSPLEGP